MDVGPSGEGSYAITAGKDRIIRIWDLKALPGAEAKPEPAAAVDKHCFRGHDGPVDAVAIGPDGRYVLSASAADRTLRQWDAATGMQKRSYLPLQNNMTVTSFSNDGRHILTLHLDSFMYSWNVDKGGASRVGGPPRRPGIPMPPPPPLSAARITPDGRGVVALNFDRVFFWNIGTPRPVRSFVRNEGLDTNRPFQMSENMRVALFRGSDVIVVSLANGNEVCRVKNDRNVGFFCAALTPDGKTLFTSGVAGPMIWDAETGKEERKLACNERFASAAFSPDGRYLLAGERRGLVRLFNVESGEEVKVFKGHEQAVQAVAFSTDGKFAATGSADTTVRLWEMPDDVHAAK